MTKKQKPTVDCWADGTPKSLNNVFTQAFSGTRLDVAKMAQSYKNSTLTSRAVSRAGAMGKNRGTVPGMSKRQSKTMITGPIADVYARKAK